MTKPAKVPGSLKLRITAACLLGAAGFAAVTEPGGRVAASFALLDAVMAGVCLWAAYRLDQVSKAERRRNN